MPGRDIFKHGASPELEAQWDKHDALVEEFKQLTTDQEREAFLVQHPGVRHDVQCEECKQWLPTD